MGVLISSNNFPFSTFAAFRCLMRARVREIGLSVRVYACFGCGSVLDRDFNASTNLEQVAVNSTETLNAVPKSSILND